MKITNISFLFFQLLSLLFCNFLFAEKDLEDGDEEIMKSLEADLEELETLLKSKKEKQSTLFDKESMSDDEEDDEDEDEEDDEEDDEDEDEDEEGEDEEPMKGKKKGYMKDKKESCGKVKKSMENFITENESIIDGNEILKSFTSSIEGMIGVVESLTDRLENLESEISKNSEITKSIGGVVTKSTTLLKSSKEAIDKMGNEPLQVKGVTNIMQKSFNTEEPKKGVGIKVSDVETFLMKSKKDATKENDLMKSSEIDKIIPRWELSNYSFNSLPKWVQNGLIAEKQN